MQFFKYTLNIIKTIILLCFLHQLTYNIIAHKYLIFHSLMLAFGSNILIQIKSLQWLALMIIIFLKIPLQDPFALF